MTRNWTLSVLAARFILVSATRISYSYWPLTWPDEALFSSPAAELAAGRAFSTPVLAGLVPGMEKATLWNSPLFMVMLAGVYNVTGESQAAGRALSLVLGFAVLCVFAVLASMLVPGARAGLALPPLLALDLPFIRAANTIRMDMLTLVWILVCLVFLLQFRRNAARPALPAFMAGLAAGLAAISHPAAILLVPVMALMLLPQVKAGLLAGAGACIGFAPWLFYIVPNYQMFRVQFMAQLDRKSSIVSLFGGDTGGVFVVYASQYGPWFVMIFVLAVTGLVLAWGLWSALRSTGWDVLSTPVRFAVSVGVVFVLILFMSEGWYILYMTPLLLLLCGMSLGKDRLSRIPLIALTILIMGSLITLTIRMRIMKNIPAAVESFEQTVATDVKECASVYLRVRPDPYFVLRKENPRMEVLEFVPGKLVFKDNETYVRARYNTIHCFLLDDNPSWEPILTNYLEQQRHQFIIRRFARPPLAPSSLWVRRDGAR
ncbi:MAG: hypothetical protein HY042_05200 [Spirochaetia bacterium]|nr:hypothetical protein [Spirochaetia bacterium]